MDSEQLKTQIGNNIAFFRRRDNLTQAELAEKLNYTDKAVSKWERGESVPDVLTLMQIARVFGVGLDDLTGGESEDVPGETPAETPAPGGKPVRKVDKNVIQMLSSLLVWFVALLVYVVLSSLNVPKSWMGFFYAVPVNAIILISLRSAWKMFNWNFMLVSILVWGCLISLHLTILVFVGVNIWKLFLLGLLGQVAVCLWFRMFRTVKEEQHG